MQNNSGYEVGLRMGRGSGERRDGGRGGGGVVGVHSAEAGKEGEAHHDEEDDSEAGRFHGSYLKSSRPGKKR